MIKFRSELNGILAHTARQIIQDRKARQTIEIAQSIQAQLQKERAELVSAFLRALAETGLGGNVRQILLENVRKALGVTARNRARSVTQSVAIALFLFGLLAGIMLNEPLEAFCEQTSNICHHLRLATATEER